MAKPKPFTTVQIYEKTLKILNDHCKKKEKLRDKLDEIISTYYRGEKPEIK